ncbi:MAG: hypothetical protein ACJAQT_001576 [Akkermansiaceae bacterium]|jgi:hypothetical protein
MKSHLIWLLLTISLFLAGTQIQKETNAHVRTASKAPHQTFPSSQSNRSPKSNSSPSLSKRTQQVRNESRAGIPNDQSPHADGIPFTNPWASRFPSINPSTTPSNSRPSDISPATPGTSTQIPENTPSLSKEQIQTLVQIATKESNPIARRLAFDQLLSSLDEFTAIPIRTALAQNKADGEQWRLFDYAWSAGDPTVLEKNLPNTAEKHRQGFISNSLPGWAFADPVAAAEFVNDYEPGPVQDQFRNRLIEGLADNDIETATDFVTQLASDSHPNTPQYVRTVASEVFETQGLPGLQKWTEELPQGPLRINAQTFLEQKSPEDTEN